jgi:hypothetical protein
VAKPAVAICILACGCHMKGDVEGIPIRVHQRMANFDFDCYSF